MLSRYDTTVDPTAPNSAHAFALSLVGYNRRVLELGAASGHVTRALVDQGCRVTAIEYEAESAQELDGVAEQVVVADLNDPEAFSGLEPRFDTILAGDVLEHLLHPQDVLRRAVRLLVPGGQVVVSVPNVAHADVRLALMQGGWDYRPWGLLDDTHTRFFTLKTIKTFVRQAGLVITELRRVRIPAFETELGLDRLAFSSEMLALALADPEAETYQFVFSATVGSGELRETELAERNLALNDELERLRIVQASLRAELELLRAAEQRHTDELAGRRLEVSTLQSELATLRTELEVTSRALRRVEGSICWQWFQSLRRGLYGMLGGERSVPGRLLQATLRVAGRGAVRRHDTPID